ncbi:MAG: isoprenylcysteine carboxylmethyltransferase family protein [Gemmatimonadales bacterium]
MTQDLTLRLATAAVLISGLAISIVYRARADREGGALPQTPPGDQPSVALRIVASVLIWGTLVATLAIPGRLGFLVLPLPLVLRWLGLGVGAAAVLLVLWVMRSIGSNVSPSSATRQGATLVTHGPYRFVRHPLYTVGVLMLLGLGLAAQSLGLLIVVASIALWLPSRVRHEERHLLAAHGDAYRHYIQTTGRFLPRLW